MDTHGKEIHGQHSLSWTTCKRNTERKKRVSRRTSFFLSVFLLHVVQLKLCCPWISFSRAPCPLPCWPFAEDHCIPRPGKVPPAHLCGRVRYGWVGMAHVFFSRNSNCGLSQGPFLSRGMAVVLKASWRSSFVMMPHGIPVSAPDGAGIRPWSRHPDSQCLETAIRSRAP